MHFLIQLNYRYMAATKCQLLTFVRKLTLPVVVAVVAIIAAAPSVALAQTPLSDRAKTSAAELGLVELKGELSRQDLFKEISQADFATTDAKQAVEASQYFNLYGPFRFPTDVSFDAVLIAKRPESVFGVDISHHTATAFPIEQLRIRKVDFVFMKATQGARFLDPKFAQFWDRAGRLPKGTEVHRGAYHFLSSGDSQVPAEEWGKAQALTFLKVIRANGGLRLTDMPPVVDLEWDKASKDSPDRWTGRTADEILRMVLAFVTTVEAELKRTPMIYTAHSWWRERIGANVDAGELSRYPLWVADYSKTSRASEVPRSIVGAKWILWQFTDAATMAIGFRGSFDANIFKGSSSAFYKSLGVLEF